MITKKGWNQKFMMSLFKKETSYDAGVTMSDANACSMRGFTAETKFGDKWISDADDMTGQEFPTNSEVFTNELSIDYKESRARPNTVAGLAALALGSITSTQDGALAAYKHKIVPVAEGTALASIQAEGLIGGLQYKYQGLKCNTIKLSGTAGKEQGFVSLEAGLIGSGTRSSSATAFAAHPVESWLKMRDCKVWMEDGSSINLDATLTQGLENISSGSPADIRPRLLSFEWSWDNQLEGQTGGSQVFADIDYGRRKSDLKFSLLFNDSTEMDYFLNQTALSIEFDLKGAGPIAATGALYYGFDLIIPRFKLKTMPFPKGGVNDRLTIDFECDIQSDLTNPAAIIEVYTAKAAYLA